MSEQAKFRIKVGDTEIELEGPEGKILPLYNKAFEWASSVYPSSAEAIQPERKKEEEEEVKISKRGGKRKAKWSPVIDDLIKEGFFKLPNRKTVSDILKEFENRGLPHTGKGVRVAIIMVCRRRIRKGSLSGTKEDGKWSFWTED